MNWPEYKPETNIYLCRSGKHEWGKLSDAHKCCNPEWRRVEKIIKSMTGFGITYLGYGWVPAATTED